MRPSFASLVLDKVQALPPWPRSAASPSSKRRRNTSTVCFCCSVELAHIGERRLETLPGDLGAPSRHCLVAGFGGDRLHGFLEDLGLPRHQAAPIVVG